MPTTDEFLEVTQCAENHFDVLANEPAEVIVFNTDGGIEQTIRLPAGAWLAIFKASA